MLFRSRLQHSPDPLAGFKGPTSKEREGREGKGEEEGGEVKAGWEKERGREGEGEGMKRRLLTVMKISYFSASL